MYKKSPKQFYRKLFGIYSLVLTGIVLILTAFFIVVTKARVLESNQELLGMQKEKASAYLTDCSRTADNMMNELYQSGAVLDDLLYYLQNEDEAYRKHRLDLYMGMTSLDYVGFDDFAEKVMKADGEILRVDFLSYPRQELTLCYPNGTVYKNLEKEEYIRSIREGNLAQEGVFSFLKEIRDPYTLENIGCMIVSFSADYFLNLRNGVKDMEILVVNGKGTVVADSTGGRGGNPEEDAYVYAEKESVWDYTVCVFMNKYKAGRIPASVLLLIWGTGLAAAAAGELLVRWYLLKLTRRLTYIIEGMEQVTTGNMEVRLEADSGGDELDLIAANFNEMCGKLDRYIQKSYLAEIEQKNAEMEVLQNQLNPHFLYNTLEAIRMKAILNKDRDVAKMLYSMSVIFRSQLKDEDVIPLVRELHYCKKYLELFEYRYQGRFAFEIDCAEEYMQIPVIKFIVQPVLENYFAHGIRGEQEGNMVSVRVERADACLCIHVEDNGRGMEEAELAEMNRRLRENTDKSRKSIGLTNVNRRIRAVYGPDYGVELRLRKEGGLHVVLKTGCMENKDEETV